MTTYCCLTLKILPWPPQPSATTNPISECAPGIKPESLASSCIGRWILYHWTTWEAPKAYSTQYSQVSPVQVLLYCRGGNDPILSESQRKGWFPGYKWVVYKQSSPIQWTWVWTNFRRRWRTGKPGMLQSTGLQRVWHDFVTEQQQYKRVTI